MFYFKTNISSTFKIFSAGFLCRVNLILQNIFSVNFPLFRIKVRECLRERAREREKERPRER